MIVTTNDFIHATILIIDDEYDARLIIRTMLQHENHEIMEAENGRKGLELFEQNNPDLIILDIMMPGMSGIETCKRIRDKDKALPILMLTGLSSEESVVQAFEAGADDFITKPPNWVVLKRRVHRLLKTRLIERELEQYRENLENIVLQRTADLQATNEALQQELAQHRATSK